MAAIIILIFREPTPVHDPSADLTEKEEEELIAEWKPKSFVPDLEPGTYDESILSEEHEVQSGPSDTIVIDGKTCLNFGTANFYGLSMDPQIIEAAQRAIDRYAVGTCGPRQFYGTMDVHLELEAAMAKFLGTEDSVNYCYPFATTTSVIQAFVRNSDVLFVDEGAWFAVRLGAELSRAKVVAFKHNDLSDLRDKVLETRRSFVKWPRVNRWVVVEGLYANDGAIVDLEQLVQIRKEFCLRLIIDETLSIGSLGKTGKGVCELFDVDRSLVEVAIGSYGTSFASLGGFTIAAKDLCSHQRLASHAYIFSASPPSFNCVAATTAIHMVEKDGEERMKKLNENIALMRRKLEDIPNVKLISDPRSALIHLQLETPRENVHEEDVILQKVCEECLASSNPTAIAKEKFVRKRDKCAPRPSLKIFVSAAHSQEEIEKAADTIQKSIAAALSE